MKNNNGVFQRLGTFTSRADLPVDADENSFACVKESPAMLADIYVRQNGAWLLCVPATPPVKNASTRQQELANMTSASILEYCGADAQKWAECFVAILTVKNLDAGDAAWMTSWFANAMMRMHDEDLWSARRFTKSGVVGALYSFVAHLNNLKPHMFISGNYSTEPLLYQLELWAKEHALDVAEENIDLSWDQYLIRRRTNDEALVNKIIELKALLNEQNRSEGALDQFVLSQGLTDQVETALSKLPKIDPPEKEFVGVAALDTGGQGTTLELPRVDSPESIFMADILKKFEGHSDLDALWAIRSRLKQSDGESWLAGDIFEAALFAKFGTEAVAAAQTTARAKGYVPEINVDVSVGEGLKSSPATIELSDGVKSTLRLVVEQSIYLNNFSQNGFKELIRVIEKEDRRGSMLGVILSTLRNADLTEIRSVIGYADEPSPKLGVWDSIKSHIYDPEEICRSLAQSALRKKAENYDRVMQMLSNIGMRDFDEHIAVLMSSVSRSKRLIGEALEQLKLWHGPDADVPSRISKSDSDPLPVGHGLVRTGNIIQLSPGVKRFLNEAFAQAVYVQSIEPNAFDSQITQLIEAGGIRGYLADVLRRLRKLDMAETRNLLVNVGDATSSEYVDLTRVPSLELNATNVHTLTNICVAAKRLKEISSADFDKFRRSIIAHPVSEDFVCAAEMLRTVNLTEINKALDDLSNQ